MSVLKSSTAFSIAPDSLQEQIRARLAREFWFYYRTRADEVIVRRRIALWTVVVRVRDLREVFVALFGPEPQV